MKLLKLIKSTIINRPSKIIKSPYMADVEVNTKNVLAHSPSLGLCGLITTNSIIMLSTYTTNTPNKNRKSNYTIELVQTINNKNKKIWIGSNSVFANKIFSIFLSKFEDFKNFSIEKAEVKIYNSRLDFCLVNNNKKLFVEVKSVPLVSYNSELKQIYATFPDGYKKKQDLCISDRAYKHLEDLIKLKKEGYRTSLVFIVQRSDAEYFSPNYEKDKCYSNKLKEAFDEGVEIYAYKFRWTVKNDIGSCKFIKKLNIIF
jgi:sugar fermentation stimulation protein A